MTVLISKEEKVFVWTQDSSKFKDKGRWVRATILGQEGAMVQANTGKAVIRVNQSKVRRDHDEWHDVFHSGIRR